MSAAVGRSCASTIKRSRQNVAIATQVLSASAIGGSLRGQRRLKHFGPPDDDEEEFISYRRRAAWKKMGYYGVAIVVTILILMGTVLAVGYFQTKNKTSASDMVLSRSVKLVQKGKPLSYIYTSNTTPQPPSAEATDSQEFSPTSHSSFLLSYPKEESEESVSSNIQNGDLYFPSASGESESSPSTSAGSDDDYLIGYNLENDKSYLNDDESNDSRVKENQQQQQTHHLVNSHSFHGDLEDEDDDNRNQEKVINIDDIESIKGDNNDKHHESGSKSNDNVDDSDSIKDTTAFEKESVQDDVSINNGDWKSEGIVVFDSTVTETLDHTKEKNGDELSTVEEKATSSPQDSVISLEIPIYSSNNKTSVEFTDDEFEAKSADPIEHLVVSSVDINKINKNDTKQSAQDNNTSNEEKHNNDDSDNYESSENIKIDSGKDDLKSKLFINTPPLFHHHHHQSSLLHTTLFNVDEDNDRDTKEKKAGATTIIIEDRGSDDEDISATGKNDQHNSNDQSLTTRQHGHGARNHNVKILKNDKVMTLKATYTPERNKQLKVRNRFRQPVNEKVEEISVSSSTDRKQKLSKDGGARNKTRSEWKLRLKVNKEEEQKTNLESLEKDVSLDGIKILKHPNKASSVNEQIEQSTFNKNYASDTAKLLQEKPRSLSTTSSFLPSFESFLKAIMSNVQPLNPKKISNSNNNNNNAVFKEHHLPQPSAPLQFGTQNYVNNLDHFLPASTIASPTLELDPAHFRKRTFNSDHDIFDYHSSIQAASPPQPDNYFDHLLGQFPTVGTIGSPSPTGASSLLNTFQSSSVYPTLPSIPSTSSYDINPSGTNDSPQLAPGVVPLDLASSFIQVGGLSKPRNSGVQQQQNQPQATQYGAHAFYDNFGDFSSFPHPTAQTNANSNGNLPLGIGTLTTAAGQAPTYNSISQGIHLLNLISGTLPNTYYQDQLYASQSTPSTFQTDAFTTSPSFQFNNPQNTNNLAATSSNNILAGRPYDFNSNLGSVINSHENLTPPPLSTYSSPSFDYHPQPNANNNVNNNNPVGNGQREQSSTYDLPSIVRALALKTDREAVEKFLEEEDDDVEDTDQVPAASSFSQSILTTFKKPPKSNKKYKKIHHQEETTTAGSIVTLMTKPKMRTTSMFRENSKPSPSQHYSHSSPKSFSFEILPQRNNYLNPSPSNSAFFDDNNALSLTNEDMYPPFEDDVSISRSKKKSSATTSSMDKPWNWKTFADPDPRSSITVVSSSINHSNIDQNEDEEVPSRKSPSLYPRKMYEKKIRKSAANNAAAAGLKSGFFT